MTLASHRSSRRSFLLGSAPAVAGGLAALGIAGAAFAEEAQNATHPASDKPWGNALPVLSLVHGSSTSSRSSFDLTVPGHDEYSLMDKFAGFGFDVWTMDFEGYGRSDSTEGNSEIASGVEDLKAATEVVARETGQERFHFFVESSGAFTYAGTGFSDE